MPLRGNLRDFTVTQLFNLINLAQKTGALIVDRSNETAQLYFQRGKLAYAKIGVEDNGLATILYRAKKLNGSQYKTIQASGGKMSDKELGLLLINAGYVTQEEILSDLQQYLADVVCRLFTWVEGIFRFENEVLPPNDRIPIRLDLENLIIEGSRQASEHEHLQDEIPTLDIALKFSDRPGANLKKVTLNLEEWRVVSYVNPKNTLRQIASATKMNEMEIRRVVYRLLEAGLVELIRPQGVTLPIPVHAFPTDDPRERRSLVDRLIDRIRAR
jgi:hypothetical protein